MLDAVAGGAHALVTIAGNPTLGGDTAVTLRVVTANGEVVLDRRFELTAADCPHAGDLISVVLEQFLREFPMQRWGEEPEPPGPLVILNSPKEIVTTRDASHFSSLLFGSVDLQAPPPSPALCLGAAIDVGSNRNRLMGSAALRFDYPHRLGDGRVIAGALLLGLGWRHHSESWQVGAETRIGAMLAAGTGYERNYHHWLLQLELVGSLTWRLSGIWVGPEVRASLLRHCVTTTQADEQCTSPLAVGMVVAVPLWSHGI